MLKLVHHWKLNYCKWKTSIRISLRAIIQWWKFLDLNYNKRMMCDIGYMTASTIATPISLVTPPRKRKTKRNWREKREMVFIIVAVKLLCKMHLLYAQLCHHSLVNKDCRSFVVQLKFVLSLFVFVGYVILQRFAYCYTVANSCSYKWDVIWSIGRDSIDRTWIWREPFIKKNEGKVLHI